MDMRLSQPSRASPAGTGVRHHRPLGAKQKGRGMRRVQARSSRAGMRGRTRRAVGRTQLCRSEVWIQPMCRLHLEKGEGAEDRARAPHGVSWRALYLVKPEGYPGVEVVFRIRVTVLYALRL